MRRYLTMLVAVAAMLALTACSRSHAAQQKHSASGSGEESSGAEMWGKNYFPNITLTSQDGVKMKFFDDVIKDKVVAINFIYTHCTDSCPMETARLLEVQKLLGDRLGKDIFFYSISIDPERDTPATLKEYARNWHTAPGWTFLTGDDADVTLLRKKLGVYEPDRKKKDHNLSLIIGNQKTGRWMKRSPAENPYVLADQLGSWLHNWKLPTKVKRDYADAPEVRNISAGEEMFRARCAACHTIGGGDLANVEERRVGPDLFNITRQRDRAWLAKWMMAPDQMLAAHDPIGTMLLAQYHDIVMPNLRLSVGDAEVLLRYVDDESQRLEHAAEVASGTAAPQAPAARAKIVIGKDLYASVRAATLAPYDQLRVRLAADDLDGAKAVAARLDGHIGGLVDLSPETRKIAAAGDLDAARAGFGELSHGVIRLLEDNPLLQTGFWLFRCPDAPGYQRWIQADGKLTNPYWGKKMLTCGSEVANWHAD